jgi:hypothetical protein
MSMPLGPGQAAFYDNDVPFQAGPGAYQIAASQQVSAATGDYFGTPATQAFEVRAPQFSLDPGEVAGVFPPASGAGDFAAVLPHVLLTEPTLPWERLIDGEPAATPWLALLVLADDEIQSVSATTPTAFLSPPAGTLAPDIDLDMVPPSVQTAAMTQLVLSTAVFEAVVPLATELPYLAHVRDADLTGTALAGLAASGTYGVILASRFPPDPDPPPPGTGGTRSQVHLVSLEGLQALLTAQPDFGSATAVALASLYSWSFTCAPAAGGTFGELMLNLIAPADDAGLLLRAPVPVLPSQPTAAQQQAHDRLSDGYAPLAYLAPSGEQTFGWYRGPFSPVVAPPLPAAASGHYASAAQCTIYDPVAGVFDLSYAAAWTLGRTMALADRHFASALYRFRRAVHQIVDVMLDRIAALGAMPADLTTLIASNALTLQFGSQVGAGLGEAVTGLATALAATTGTGGPDVMPPAPPPGPPAVTQIQDLLSIESAASLALQSAADQLAPVAAWLARLSLADRVPFTHLVPDPAMLPVESIRFFYLDPAWISALQDGALSVAIESSRDLYIQQVFGAGISAAVEAAGGTTPAAGMLLRSAVVSGWPGLTVTATAGGAAVAAPRIVRLSPSILLYLFARVPDTIYLSEPAQGLRFGAQDGPSLALRQLTAPVGKQTGTFPATETLTSYYRSAAVGVPGGVLSISRLVPDLASALGVTSPGPADIAIQLVQAPEQLQFAPGGGG